jgi:hypothetical protein
MSQTHLKDLYGHIVYTWNETTNSVNGDLIPLVSEYSGQRNHPVRMVGANQSGQGFQ